MCVCGARVCVCVFIQDKFKPDDRGVLEVIYVDLC